MNHEVEYVVIGLGAWGSAAAYHLAKRGHSVLGLERFELGHDRGASHDTSRILRHSYHAPCYVQLSFDAYDDWMGLEADTGEELVTTVGGLDLFPPDGQTPVEDYAGSMAACEVDFERLDVDDVRDRWPQFRLPAETVALFQPRGSVVPAARGTAAMQQVARRYGADLRDRSQVTAVHDRAEQGIEVHVGHEVHRCQRVVVCADAWTNEVLAGLDVTLPLTVTLEQVTYFSPADSDVFAPGRFPLWIWMDDPAFYGFPCYGEDTVKAAQDCGGAVVTGDDRPFEADRERLEALAGFMSRTLPDSGTPVRSKTCLYTLPPDRDFVLSQVPGHDSVSVGLGAGHGFKFSPTAGRLLADLAEFGTTESDLTPFRVDRPALTENNFPVHWRF
jgi:monomeric sarcosine oxidase